MNKKITTLKDIAKALQIAPSTVSKALRESSDLSEEMKTKVKKAASKMNYSPNYMAQRLRDRKTRIVVVIVPHLTDNFYPSVIDGMEEIAFRRGYNLIVHKSGDNFQREQLLLQSLTSHVDGVLVSISAETKKFDHLRQLKQKNIPLLLFDRYTDKVSCSKVVFNDEKMSFAITEQLVKSGCRQVAYVCGPVELSTYEYRIKGYKDALAANDIQFDDKLLIPTKLSKQEGKQAFHALMHQNKHVDAIITDTSTTLLSIYNEKKRIVAVGKHISLATFDSNELYDYLQQPVSYVSVKGYEMGSHALQICINEIEATEKIKIRKETISTELILRTNNQSDKAGESQKTSEEYSRGRNEEIIYVY